MPSQLLAAALALALLQEEQEFETACPFDDVEAHGSILRWGAGFLVTLKISMISLGFGWGGLV